MTPEDLKNYINEYEAEKQFALNQMQETELTDEQEMWQIIYDGFSDIVSGLKRLNPKA